MICKMASITQTDPEIVDDSLDESIDESLDELYFPGSIFEKILDSGSDSHIRWLLITTLMRNIVKRYDVVIFGGAVRDFVLHNYCASKFYEVCERNKYNDATIHPELSDRFLLPTDIDFFIKSSQYDLFKSYIYRRGFYYAEEKKMDMTYVNPELVHGQYTLIKAEIMFVNKKNKKSYSIKLDTILCDRVVIPPMDTDFSVNKLLMTRNGIVASNCEWSYNQILEHIHNKEAYCNSTISDRRYEKLQKKGWKLITNYSTFVFKIRTNEEEECCIICLDNLKIGELEITPRECKCKYSYCRSCLKFSLKSSRCLMCKKIMCDNKKRCDIIMYEKYQLLDK